ncbi:DUF1128 domain-containing protein [Paenibacillus thermotolerans]|uniref:DUF1128 domain-containing protein n=1 Tax=Paenibacillus thermotolerans TaxID=3027807 RepID=UPI0023674674|nr:MULTISPECIES: DUF1128 domain-containing protein [unclassified Paenibacillus]
MDLSKPSQENAAFMVEEITKRLRMATGAAVKAVNISQEQYEDLLDMYELVTSKDRYSISEIEAIVSELGKLRNT